MDHLLPYIGNWGWYQSYVYVLMSVPSFLDGCQTIMPAFIYAIPNTRCYVPSYDGPGNESYQRPFRDNISHLLFPAQDTEGKKDVYCRYCPWRGNSGANCVFNNSITCDHGYVYDKSQYRTTLGMQFEMVCDRAWMIEALRSLFMVGVLIGGVVLGPLSDKYGRKVVFIASGLFQLLVANVLPFVNNYYAFAFLQLLLGVFCVGTFLIAFVNAMELAGGNAGTVAGIGMQMFFTIGYLYLGMIAYLIRYWEWIQWACSFPTFVYPLYFWLLPESLRWSLMKGDKEQVKKLLRLIGRFNGKHIPEEVVEQAIAETRQQANQGGGADGNGEAKKSTSLLDIRSYKRLVFITLAMGLSWAVCSMTYYGLSLNTNDWPGDEYANFIYSGLVDVPSYVIVIPLFTYVGRKISLIVALFVGGVFCIASGVTPVAQGTMVVAFALTGKAFMSAAYAMVYNYAVEIFPTSFRNAGTGFCSTCARIGSISAPQIHILAHYVARWLPIVIFGVAAVISSVFDVILPETRNHKLPESVEDMIELSKKRTKQKDTLVNQSAVEK